ncbi:MAG: DUF2156 domain-containing protein [Treponema sp.]|nr:DUF2156 domain-containing protein [Treponema sp.]
MNWHLPSISDLETLQTCALSNGFFANNYSAVNSVIYERKFQSQIAVEDGWIFEKSIENGIECFSFPHAIGGGQADSSGTGGSQAGSSLDIQAALARLTGDAGNSDRQADQHTDKTIVFTNVTADEKDILADLYPGANIVPTPESGDYIYRTEDLAGLAGKKYSRKRNHIHQFEKSHPNCRFEPLKAENCAAVRSIEAAWLQETADEAAAAGSLAALELERDMIFFALEHFDSFTAACGMSGGILFAAGQPVAFCLASLLSRQVTDVHFEKCIASFAQDGGYAVINNAFAKTVTTAYINREEDLGIEGLRKAKLSYYPDRILEKYSVTIG